MVLCDECNDEGKWRCSGCLSGWYCSKACQKKAWSVHKVLCKTLKDFQIRPAPKTTREGFTRAIYFHPEESTPRFVWLKHKCVPAEDQHTSAFTLVCPGALAANNEEEAKYNDDISMRNSWIQRNYALLRELPYTIWVSHREGFLHDGSRHNKATDKISDLQSRHLYDWRGPMIVYGREEFEGRIQDLFPVDLRLIRHWLNSYRFEGKYSPETLKQELSDVVGVRMNCIGDEKVDGRPKCEAAMIPGYHRIFEVEAAPISERLGFPVMVCRIPGSVNHWKQRSSVEGMCAYVNQPATMLHLGCEPTNTEGMMKSQYAWGWAPWKWQNDVGSVIIVRKDKKHLLPEHAEALADFCQNYLLEIFGEQKESECGVSGSTPGLGKEYVLEKIAKEKFLEYYEAWKARQMDEVKRNQISPYDV
ncbi:hypothetical protein BDW02DRAFT_92701 [Decorospora gaudefroyi]|uniref:MYND-type domain-containing protein n=1 Tax=Decorospora gaudefroyi TaxID=184978 RepID=A0A6A5KBG2_9PLEO|nr:hypothetical protein BDW02DRAFT_92701 [Decorospora gaudefroyi]